MKSFFGLDLTLISGRTNHTHHTRLSVFMPIAPPCDRDINQSHDDALLLRSCRDVARDRLS